MIDLNSFTVVGKIGFIEKKNTANNTAVTNIVVYVSDDYKDQAGDWVNRSYRIMVSFFGPRADGIARVFAAKDKVWIRGKITTGEREEDGKKVTSIYFNGDEIGKISTNSSADDAPSTPARKTAPQKTSARPKSTWSSKSKPAPADDDDLDLDDLLDDDDVV